MTSEAGEGQDHQGFFKMLRLYPASKGKMKSLKCFLTGRDREEGYDQTKILETSAVGGEPEERQVDQPGGYWGGLGDRWCWF